MSLYRGSLAEPAPMTNFVESWVLALQTTTEVEQHKLGVTTPPCGVYVHFAGSSNHMDIPFEPWQDNTTVSSKWRISSFLRSYTACLDLHICLSKDYDMKNTGPP